MLMMNCKPVQSFVKSKEPLWFLQQTLDPVCGLNAIVYSSVYGAKGEVLVLKKKKKQSQPHQASERAYQISRVN